MPTMWMQRRESATTSPRSQNSVVWEDKATKGMWSVELTFVENLHDLASSLVDRETHCKFRNFYGRIAC